MLRSEFFKSGYLENNYKTMVNNSYEVGSADTKTINDGTPYQSKIYNWYVYPRMLKNGFNTIDVYLSFNKYRVRYGCNLEITTTPARSARSGIGNAPEALNNNKEIEVVFLGIEVLDYDGNITEVITLDELEQRMPEIRQYNLIGE